MAKLGEREVMEGVKQGAIVGVGIGIITALSAIIPYAPTILNVFPVIPVGPVTLDTKLVVEAIIAAIGGNWIVSMFK